MPALERMGRLNPKDIEDMDIDTLADRLREDVVKRNAIQMLPIMFGAWSHRRA